MLRTMRHYQKLPPLQMAHRTYSYQGSTAVKLTSMSSARSSRQKPGMQNCPNQDVICLWLREFKLYNLRAKAALSIWGSKDYVPISSMAMLR
jgi:hypothetical protein